ncbi:unnamed protein product, partial [Rotaria sordida]
LVMDGHRQEAIDLVNKQIALLKDVEKLDDEKGMISLLLRLAQHMLNKLNNENIDKKLISRGYEHQTHLKDERDYEDMGFGLFD